MKRFLSLILILRFLFSISSASAAKATPTPAPLEIETEVIETVPEKIQQLLDLSYAQLLEVNGAEMKEKNKYTKWRNNYSYGWCGGFITWCMLELGIPQNVWNKTPKEEIKGMVPEIKNAVSNTYTDYSEDDINGILAGLIEGNEVYLLETVGSREVPTVEKTGLYTVQYVDTRVKLSVDIRTLSDKSGDTNDLPLESLVYKYGI